MQDGICQLRLDFDRLVLNNPANTGICTDLITTTSPTGASPPRLCGALSGQHSKDLNNVWSKQLLLGHPAYSLQCTLSLGAKQQLEPLPFLLVQLPGTGGGKYD